MSECVMESNSFDDTSDVERSSRDKYELKASLRAKLVDTMPEVLHFIEMLEKYIKKQRKQLKKWKSRMKKMKQCKHVSTQTSQETDEVKGEESKSLAEDIKEAAEQAMQNSGFVYEETSGMYYDYSTGYYYNAEYGLYYDGNSGTYLKYNQETQTYDFHSQVPTPKQEQTKTKRKISRKKRTAKEKDAKRAHKDDDALSVNSLDREEGECSSLSSSNEGSEEEAEVKYPPCVRIIIESTSVSDLKVGSLHIITFEGGSIGREGNHSLIIPDINISKHHLKISYDEESRAYQLTDMGSRNGTLLNGKRMSASQQESETLPLVHGSKIQIGSTILLCHIHEGNQTCGHCEPGLLLTEDVKPSQIKVGGQHKNELKKLKKKYGITGYEETGKLPANYTDRASKRRDTVGSQNPHEKTQTASVDQFIPAQNKGFKMLAKMGWKEGESLGKDGTGHTEPVQVCGNQGTTGMGSDIKMTLNPVKKSIWLKTQERFQKLPNEVTVESDDDLEI